MNLGKFKAFLMMNRLLRFEISAEDSNPKEENAVSLAKGSSKLA